MLTQIWCRCHAYEFVRCRRKAWNTNGGSEELRYDWGHDVCFASRVSVVHERSVRELGIGALEGGQPYKKHHCIGETWDEARRKLEVMSMG